jgi:hypothetical protein
MLTPIVTSAASDLSFESGNRKTVMVELFTSEGCNSCPPAEEMLNRYRDDPGLWKTFVPLAWHVDYWDYLGWKDPYSSAENSNRQRHYAQVQRSRTVYTPNFVVNGLNWRPGILSARPAPVSGDAGNLKVQLQKGNLLAQLVTKESTSGPLQLNVALLGMGLVSNIRAGENAGRKAHHEFVVLKYQTSISTDARWQFALDTRRVNSIAPGALAVWVSRADDPTPLQAAGALLPVDF